MIHNKNVAGLKEQISGYVNYIDPWHLIEMGAPEDEYNSHVDRIVSFVVNKNPDQASLEKELFEIFKTKEFELDQVKMKDLSEKICSL